jgi:hypothetical protein
MRASSPRKGREKGKWWWYKDLTLSKRTGEKEDKERKKEREGENGTVRR